MEEWKVAWESELNQLIKLGTWKVVERPSDKLVIPFGIVLHEKPGLD